MLWKQHCLFGALDSPCCDMRHVAPKFLVAVGSPRVNPSGPVGSRRVPSGLRLWAVTPAATRRKLRWLVATLPQRRWSRRGLEDARILPPWLAMTIRPLTSADFCWLLLTARFVQTEGVFKLENQLWCYRACWGLLLLSLHRCSANPSKTPETQYAKNLVGSDFKKVCGHLSVGMVVLTKDMDGIALSFTVLRCWDIPKLQPINDCDCVRAVAGEETDQYSGDSGAQKQKWNCELLASANKYNKYNTWHQWSPMFGMFRIVILVQIWTMYITYIIYCSYCELLIFSCSRSCGLHQSVDSCNGHGTPSRVGSGTPETSLDQLGNCIDCVGICVNNIEQPITTHIDYNYYSDPVMSPSQGCLLRTWTYLDHVFGHSLV